MSSIIADPNDPILKAAHDPFWDSPITRREMQSVFNKLGRNDAELMGMADTAALLLNFLFEHLGIKDRKPVDEYVERKKAELEILRKAAVAQVTSTEANG
jgi:hypothetical protein